MLIEAAALIGTLGVTLLTTATIIGALTGSGAALIIATRMVAVSNSAHNDINKAYDLIKIIKNQ